MFVEKARRELLIRLGRLKSSPHVEVETRAPGRGKLLFGLSAREDKQMAKYHNWTIGDIEALINVLGGSEIALEIKDRRRQFTVGELIRPESPARPPLGGRVVKTITIPAYSAPDFPEAVRLGAFDNAVLLGDTLRQFAKERVGLTKPAKIDLVEFDRDWWKDEAIAWGQQNGNKNPLAAAHLLGIAIGLPNEQREWPIIELGSVQGVNVLFLHGDSDRRNLYRSTVRGLWGRHFIVGFVSK